MKKLTLAEATAQNSKKTALIDTLQKRIAFLENSIDNPTVAEGLNVFMNSLDYTHELERHGSWKVEDCTSFERARVSKKIIDAAWWELNGSNPKGIQQGITGWVAKKQASVQIASQQGTSSPAFIAEREQLKVANYKLALFEEVLETAKAYHMERTAGPKDGLPVLAYGETRHGNAPLNPDTTAHSITQAELDELHALGVTNTAHLTIANKDETEAAAKLEADIQETLNAAAQGEVYREA
jgi:hypothetical protein